MTATPATATRVGRSNGERTSHRKTRSPTPAPMRGALVNVSTRATMHTPMEMAPSARAFPRSELSPASPKNRTYIRMVAAPGGLPKIPPGRNSPPGSVFQR